MSDNSEVVIGRKIGAFTVVEQVATGVTAAVYRMTDAHGRNRALKVLHPAFQENREIASRFRREARLAGAIEHEHLVDIIDTGELEDGLAYFTMEWLEGVRLSDILAAEPRFTCFRAIQIARGVGEALAAVHAHGIIHRDLKPENILLVHRQDDADFVKLLDFGIAKLAVDQQRFALTKEGALFGTPQYMSPEQCKGAQLDRRSDVYGLGLMVYEMLAGRPAFEANNVGDMILKQIRETPVDLRTIDPSLPEEIALAVQRALAKSPDERFPQIDSFVAELVAALEKLPVPTLTAPTPTTAEVIVALEPAVMMVPQISPDITQKMDRPAIAKVVVEPQARDFETEHDAFFNSSEEELAALESAAAPEEKSWLAQPPARRSAHRRNGQHPRWVLGSSAAIACLSIGAAWMARPHSRAEAATISYQQPTIINGAENQMGGPPASLEALDAEPKAMGGAQDRKYVSARRLAPNERATLAQSHPSGIEALTPLAMRSTSASVPIPAALLPTSAVPSPAKAAIGLGAHTVTVHIVDEVPGSALTIDGERVENPFTGTFPKGDWRHLVEVSTPGHPNTSNWMVFDQDRAMRVDSATGTLK